MAPYERRIGPGRPEPIAGPSAVLGDRNSPPTITQPMPSRGNFPTAPISGSTDKKRIGTGVCCRWRTRESLAPSSTETPSHMCRGAPGPIANSHIVAHQRAALSQHLEGMPVGKLHRIEYAIHELDGHQLVKEVAHRVNKDHARSAPLKRLLQPLGPKGQIKPSAEGMVRDTPEPFRESLCVAMVAARADLGASRHRIPGRVSPFDRCAISH